MRNRIFWILFFLPIFVFSKDIKVSIFGDRHVSSWTIKIERGLYDLFGDGAAFEFKKETVLNIVLKGDSIYLNGQGNDRSYGQSIELVGKDFVNYFSVWVDGKWVIFDDNLLIKANGAHMDLINFVDLDHYVAGVVEGEAGYRLPLEYYKLQAILCRTYALKNSDRHAGEGFDLCDKVHCQVYHHKCTKEDIVHATASTSGLVVINDDLELINTTFHSNCGGQTCNSEDVWIQKVDYLRSVKDSFCLHSPHARWQKEVPKDEYLTKISKYQPLDSLGADVVLNFCQDSARFAEKNVLSTPLTKLRMSLGVNSTYFSVEEVDSTKVVLYGRGFGHAVGLCQEGGMEMARIGFSYVDILKYYFTGIHIVNLKALEFFKD